MGIGNIAKKLDRAAEGGFLLIETLVSLVIVSSVLSLVILVLHRSESLSLWFQSGKDTWVSVVGKSKLTNTYIGKQKNISAIKQIGETQAVGKKICDFDVNNLEGSDFDESYLSNIRIVDVASSTEITFVRTIKDWIYIGLDSSSTTDPDILVYSKQTITEKMSPGHDVDISKDIAVYSLDSGPGVRAGILAGNIFFVLGSGTTEHVKAFRILPDGLPQLLWGYKLPVSGAVGRTFAFDGDSKKLFVGLEKNSGPEFFSIQLSLNAGVEWEESKEIGGSVNYIYTLGEVVYVMNTLDPEIIIFSIKGLDKIGEYDAVGAVGNGKRLDHISGGFIFGRTIYGNEISFISSTSTLDAASLPTTYIEEWGNRIKASVDDIVSINSGFILLSTLAGGQVDLYRLDSSGYESAEVGFRTVQNFKLPYGRGTDLFCDRSHLYIAARYEPVFYILPIK